MPAAMLSPSTAKRRHRASSRSAAASSSVMQYGSVAKVVIRTIVLLVSPPGEGNVKTMSAPKLDGRIERGAHTRHAILERAAAIASVEGLDRLSIGRLATELRASKSGVFAHFGSKEELQLATVQRAGEVFVAEVIAPALRAPGGLRRLWRLCDGWLDYSKRRVFPGGCFFVSVAAEFDARPGRVREDRKSTRLNSSHVEISYAVFCLKKKK